jgi:hypothetical protein
MLAGQLRKDAKAELSPYGDGALFKPPAAFRRSGFVVEPKTAWKQNVTEP